MKNKKKEEEVEETKSAGERGENEKSQAISSIISRNKARLFEGDSSLFELTTFHHYRRVCIKDNREGERLAIIIPMFLSVCVSVCVCVWLFCASANTQTYTHRYVMMMMMVPDYRIWSPGKGGIFCMLMRGNLSVFLEDGAPKSPAIFTYISLFARKREKLERERERERKKKKKWRIEIKHLNIF